MSAPNTDPDKQTRRHKPSLLGMAVVVVFALALLFGLLSLLSAEGNTPEGADEQVDGRTGEIVEE